MLIISLHPGMFSKIKLKPIPTMHSIAIYLYSDIYIKGSTVLQTAVYMYICIKKNYYQPICFTKFVNTFFT